MTVDTGMGRWAFEQGFTVKSIYPPSTAKYLVHFSCEVNSASSLTTSVGSSPPIILFPLQRHPLAQNRAHLQTLAIEDPSGAFPTTTSNFSDKSPLGSSQLVSDVLQHGRQLESFNLTVLIDCPTVALLPIASNLTAIPAIHLIP
ncbi:hypothetical protein K435DRAFT_871735 [Dendrothele bispora CBS 962.96]|uniref:Uncharacterized protein n=1 Tax=Dendrothele bispora (strain CBS 962.96) TaxID=1314807 RepID=A0A4V4HCG0_DENBC|nr:hypothetical protein K435DRAFT_871735 [Dendrothele bispora CBS 962.96]